MEWNNTLQVLCKIILFTITNFLKATIDVKNQLREYISELFKVLEDFGQDRNWHLKYAKFNRQIHQSLLAHCLNVSSLSYCLLEYLNEQKFVEVTDKLRIQVILTGFLHDAGKDSPSYQTAVADFLAGRSTEPLDFGHQQAKDISPIVGSLQNIIEDKLPLTKDFSGLWEEIIWSISQMGRREDAASITQTFKRSPSDNALLSKEVVHLADVMMSKMSIEDAASVALDGPTISKIQFMYSKVAIVRGVLTQFLHSALESQLTKETGFRAIQWFPEGTVYVGRADIEVPKIDSAAIVNTVVRKMRDFLSKSPLQVARAVYGSLTAQVIAAPEFLFLDDKIIHEFWQFISTQRFAKVSIKNVNDLKGTEKKIYELLLLKLNEKDDSTKLTLLCRFISDFNLLIVLYATKKQLVENSLRNGKREIETEATRVIQENLSTVLKIPRESFAAWPEIANQTKAENRLPVAETFWQSPYYANPISWQHKFLEALERTTKELAEIWRREIPDKYNNVARLLLSDISHPLDPKEMMRTVEKLNAVITKGKTGHGTPTCQRCGGVAMYEAQAELFGQSEIYHDNLVAGSRVAGGNKIQVCELCEFEEKLRSVFLSRGQEPFSTFYIFPQLALSRNRQLDWQRTIHEINDNLGKFPPLVRVDKWAEVVTEGKIRSFPEGFGKSASFSSEGDLAQAIDHIAEKNGLDDLSSMIEPPLDAKNGRAVANYLKEGKCVLKERYNREVRQYINRVEPVYLSPNFIVLITNSTVANRDEPESSAAIKWLFFKLLLARLFLATVRDDESVKERGSILGYVRIPTNLVLKPLAEKFNTRQGWIPISELEMSLRRLAALILTARELSNEKADYGNSTLLRLLNEEPGRVLVRLTNRTKVRPNRLLYYLDTWYSG
jgi:hypothetical protein